MDRNDDFKGLQNMSCETIREHLEAYALGILDAHDLALVEQHLEECPSCRRLVEEYLEMTHLLPQALASASRMQVPHSLRDRLIQAIQPVASKPSDTARPELGRFNLATLLKRIAALPRLNTTFAITVLIMAILSLVLNAHLTVALAKERSLRAEFANLVDQQELVLEVIDSNQTTKMFLGPVESDSRSYGKIYTRSDMTHAVVMAARLSQPPAGQAYHLWLTEQNRTYLAGVLQLNDQGFGLLVFESDHAGPVYESAQLTLQPLFMPGPTGTPVLQWEASP